MLGKARELLVAMFEANVEQRESVRVALELTTPHLRAARCCDVPTDPQTVRAQLAAAHADLVVWDASPATFGACELLESLLLQRAFGCCGLVVTTTDAMQIRAFLGASAGGVPIVEKPYAIQQLVQQLERVAVSRLPH